MLNDKAMTGSLWLVYTSLAGGSYGLFDGRIDEVVKNRPEANQILKSSDVFPIRD